MAAKLLDNRNRAVGLIGAVVFHALAIGLVVLLGTGQVPLPVSRDSLVAVTFNQPPPPAPPPDRAEEGAAAPTSRGPSEAPSPPQPPRPLPTPTPATVSVDAGAAAGAGAGVAAGSGAGRGGEGTGSGSGGSGTGSGSGTVTPPQRIAGGLTNGDYRNARAPQGAFGTVLVEFRVRADGNVDSCRVLRSSSYPMFDEATCRLIQQRFRYRPARDAEGRAVDWTIRTDYTWAPR